MNKKRIVGLLLCVITIFIIGCGRDKVIEKKDLDVTEGLKAEEILLFSPNANFKIYDEVSKQRQFYVDVVATEKIIKEKLSVKVNTGVAYEYNIELVEDEELDINTYLGYIGKTEKLEKLRKEDYASYKHDLDKYQEELNDRKIKKIYHYRIYITVTQIYGDTDIDLIEVKYMNNTYRTKAGNVKIYSNTKLKNTEYGINMKTIASSEVKTNKNKDGIENYTDSQVFKTTDEIAIKDIRLFHSENKIKKCSFMIANKNKSTEQQWKNEKINIPKGSDVGINLDIVNEQLKMNHQYQGNEYIIIEYEYKNKDYCTYWEINFDSSLTGYELCVYSREQVKTER